MDQGRGSAAVPPPAHALAGSSEQSLEAQCAARADDRASVADVRAPEGDLGADDAGSRLRNRIVPGALFAVITLCIATDFVGDIVRGGESALHLTGMAIGTVLSATGAWMMLRMLRASGARAVDLARTLDDTRADLRRWREQAAQISAGLGVLIDKQFNEWDLSPAEREVALLLVKGLSLKEIAAVRRASEPTVRQQAQAVYRKAELTGRAELAAFFLEDLLQPRHADVDASTPTQARTAGRDRGHR